MRVLEVDREDEDLAALFLELWRDLDALYGPNPGTEFRPRDMPAAAALFVAYDDDGPVGCAAIQPWSDAGEAFEVKRMYVRPRARGTSAAATLLSALERGARERGARSLRLETGVKQPRAIAFYRREGFAPCPCWGAYADDPTSVCFSKPLP